MTLPPTVCSVRPTQFPFHDSESMQHITARARHETIELLSSALHCRLPKWNAWLAGTDLQPQYSRTPKRTKQLGSSGGVKALRSCV